MDVPGELPGSLLGCPCPWLLYDLREGLDPRAIQEEERVPLLCSNGFGFRV